MTRVKTLTMSIGKALKLHSLAKFFAVYLFLTGLENFHSRILSLKDRRECPLKLDHLRSDRRSIFEASLNWDILYEIFRFLPIMDLIRLGEASKFSKKAIHEYIVFQASEEDRLWLVKDAFRGIEYLREKIREEEKAMESCNTGYLLEIVLVEEIKRANFDDLKALKKILKVLLDTFKTGEMTDFQIDQIWRAQDAPICIFDDIRVHKNLKLAVLDALDFENPDTIRAYKLSDYLTVPHHFNARIANAKLIGQSGILKRFEHRRILDLYHYVLSREEPSGMIELETIKMISRSIIQNGESLSEADKRLLNDPEFILHSQPPEQINMHHVVIAGYLANDSNWKLAWNFCSSAPPQIVCGALLFLIRKKGVSRDFLLQMVQVIEDVTSKFVSPSHLILQFLMGSAYPEVYLALLKNLNKEGSIEDGSFVGFSTSNTAAAKLEKLVILGEYEDHNELLKVIHGPDFKPSIILGLVCAMKGIPSSVIWEMFYNREFDLFSGALCFFNPECVMLITTKLDQVNIDSLKVLIAVLLKTNKGLREQLILDTRVVGNDETMLELVKYVYGITKKPFNIREFSCWSYPRTAAFILNAIELEGEKSTGIFEGPIGKQFKEWALTRGKTICSSTNSS